MCTKFTSIQTHGIEAQLATFRSATFLHPRILKKLQPSCTRRRSLQVHKYRCFELCPHSSFQGSSRSSFTPPLDWDELSVGCRTALDSPNHQGPRLLCCPGALQPPEHACSWACPGLFFLLGFRRQPGPTGCQMVFRCGDTKALTWSMGFHGHVAVGCFLLVLGVRRAHLVLGQSLPLPQQSQRSSSCSCCRIVGCLTSMCSIIPSGWSTTTTAFPSVSPSMFPKPWP